RDNVFVQVKNGPLDFMPREPFHPLFGALPKTPAMVELQITQEYLGQSTHLVYLAPMWKEFFDADTFVKGPGSTVAKVADGSLQGQRRTGIAGVANTGTGESHRDADARLARGLRELHDAARPASSDWRRSLRRDAAERRPTARRL